MRKLFLLLVALALVALVLGETSSGDSKTSTSGSQTSTSDSKTSTSGSETSTSDSKTTGTEDSSSGGVETDDGNDEYDRTVQKTSESSDKVEFESRDKAGVSENRLKFLLTTEDGEIEVRLEVESRDTSGKVEGEFRFEVEQIIEFMDNNTNPGFQDGEEVDVIDLSKKELVWKDMNCFINGTVYVCRIISTDSQLEMVAYLTSESTIVAGTPVRPTGAKVDFIINKLNRVAGSKIALQLKLKSSIESQTEKSESDEEKEGFAKESEKQVSFGDAGFFSWVETAQINGVNVNVVNTPLVPISSSELENGEYGHRVVFTFDSTEQGTIVWDPKLNWSADQLTSSVAALVPGFALVASLAALLL